MNGWYSMVQYTGARWGSLPLYSDTISVLLIMFDAAEQEVRNGGQQSRKPEMVIVLTCPQVNR